MSDVTISTLPPDFDCWQELLDLITDAFAYMDGIIDPPSSATRLTLVGLKAKVQEEIGYLALDGDRLVGCIFCAERPDSFYVGKLAIAADHQRSGLGRALMQHAEALALRAGKPALELQVRVELTGNQAAFARMGFVEIARTSHPGYDRPTTIAMRKALN